MKKIAFTMLAVFVLILSTNFVFADLNDGLVAHWPLNGNADDASGNDNHGTEYGGVSYVSGVVGTAASFDGVDDFVNIPAAKNLNITSSFTWAAWINPLSLSNAPVIMSKELNTFNRVGFQIFSDGSLCGYFDSDSCSIRSIAGDVTTDQFTHVAFVFDATAEVTRLYANGLLVAIASETRSLAGNGVDLTIGKSRLFGFSFGGRIDEVRIYNLALSEIKIHQLYQGGCKDLLFTPVTPCRIVDTRKTSAGILDVNSERVFHVFGMGSTISAQGGNSSGCPSPGGHPYAAHINMVAVNPKGKGNLQAFPVGVEAGAGLSVNYNTIDTNLANAGTVKTVIGTAPDITVASNFSSAHTVIDVLGYYYPDDGFYYTTVDPCRIVDTRKTSAGIIDVNTQRNFDVFGPVGDQGGDPVCPSTLSVDPEAAHINMVAVDPAGKGNLQTFPVGAGPGAGMSVNYNIINTNLANAGTVKTFTGLGPDISVASNFSSAHTVIDVLGYYSEEEDLLYTPVIPCRIVDTRRTSAGMIDANTQRDFRVFGAVGGQGGDSDGCSAPMDEPLAAHINMIAVNPTGKGNLQAFPVGAGKGAGLSVNYNTIDTNLANAGTVKTVTGAGPDITVASNFSSAHTVIDVLGYYYPAP